MRELTRVCAAVFNEPWLIEPGKMELIAAALEHAMAHGEPWAAPGANPSMKRDKAVCEMVGSTAIIPVEGVISKKANLLTNISGGATCEAISQQLDAALSDPNCTAIVMKFDTPGGAVAGVPELATKIRDARTTSPKPIYGFAEMACSAGYWLMAQCDECYCSEAATVGSIGVVMQVEDRTRQMKNAGVDPVVIRSSELKAAGAGPLTPNQMSSLQGRVMQLFEMFKGAVTAGRPSLSMDIENVATGDVWIGQKAKEMGLVDGVTTLESLLERIG